MNKKAKEDLDTLHEDVPANYYHNAIKKNLFQIFWHNTRISEIKKILYNLHPDIILDVGCHAGLLTHEIFLMNPKKRIYGIDISSQAIEFAKRKYKKITFAVARAEKLPFKNAAFDLVTCFEVMEHVPNPSVIVKEVKRVLKKRGTFLVLVPTENTLFKLIWFVWAKFGPAKVWKHTHIQEFKKDSLDHILLHTGFKVIKRKTFLLGMLLLIQAEKK